MAFENKGQYLINSQQAYAMMKEYNKMLRDKNVSSTEEEQKLKTQTAQKQSGFGKY